MGVFSPCSLRAVGVAFTEAPSAWLSMAQLRSELEHPSSFAADAEEALRLGHRVRRPVACEGPRPVPAASAVPWSGLELGPKRTRELERGSAPALDPDHALDLERVLDLERDFRRALRWSESYCRLWFRTSFENWIDLQVLIFRTGPVENR
ncbi:hypothetical protein HPB50_009652 [Hyalomma asiaticum]|uniref:Uncharacterized protein n=1 Tax=Hyalomma asiaticum TaxID=266040 RepID=A0ACB7S8W6_HYAAI|nr:hypothetical protein HPB50_009652 [Hyalomma asiaticum]